MSHQATGHGKNPLFEIVSTSANIEIFLSRCLVQ